MSARRGPAGVFILRSLQLGLSTAVAVASLWGLLGGCREQGTAPIDRNRAPQTFLTFAPGDSQTTFYRVALHWWGTDNDGAVTGFDVALTESLPKVDLSQFDWHRTRRGDSLITCPVEETREVLGHRFYVRAVDNEGKFDATPAWVFFGARDNVAPTVTFRSAVAFGPEGQIDTLRSSDPNAPTDTIPTGWGVRFRWTGSDGDRAIDPDGQVRQVGRVAKFYHRLLPYESGFLGGTLSDTTAVYGPELFDRFPQGSAYAFNVRAVDDGGLSGSGTVTRSFIWNRDPESRIQRCVRPEGGDSLRCFVSKGETHFEGDTLALPATASATDSFPNPKFSATAWDPDPTNGDHTVISMEWRTSARGVFTPWTPLTPGDLVRLDGLRTGDYFAMVRSVDQLQRVEGTPDTLRFYINFSPRFITADESVGFQQTPMPGDVFAVTDVQNGLLCRFLVTNPDAIPTEKVRYGYRFEGESTYTFSDPRDGRPPYSFTVKPGGFAPGSYVLRVRVEDNAQESDRGSRGAERAVPFTVIAR